MRVPKTGSRRIEFKTRTDEQKMLFEQKKDEMGFKTLSAMARHALEQLIEGSELASPFSYPHRCLSGQIINRNHNAIL